MSTIVSDISNFIPVLRVNNRNLNTRFYEENFGFDKIYEESSLAIFQSKKKDRFILEESPSMRTRAVVGDKKLRRLSFKAKQKDILELIKKINDDSAVFFKGKKGYAFQMLSPEKDLILIHSEDSIDDLEKISRCDLLGIDREDIFFKGISKYKASDVEINVLDVKKSLDFYEKVFSVKAVGNKIELPTVNIHFHEAHGKDLTVSQDETWDLELLEFTVDEAANLGKRKKYFDKLGINSHIDKAEKTLILEDESGIELWFMKD